MGSAGPNSRKAAPPTQLEPPTLGFENRCSPASMCGRVRQALFDAASSAHFWSHASSSGAVLMAWARRSESRPFAARKVDHLRV